MEAALQDTLQQTKQMNEEGFMVKPIKVVDVELSKPLKDLQGLGDYAAAQVLVRLHGTPLGYLSVPLTGGGCSAGELGRAIMEAHSYQIFRYLLQNALLAGEANDITIEDLPNLPRPRSEGPFPRVTVAVCTRNRSEDLALCLPALLRLDYPNLDLLVVDNAPGDDSSERLVQEQYPQVRYVLEPRPGLDWARNRAVNEAEGDIIAFTDDDVIVDEQWVRALVRVFNESPDVMAVTGLVVPYELETEAQQLFESYGGFGRGFERRWVKVPQGKRRRWTYYGTGSYGTGANMAFRRELFTHVGGFDPALDVGTVTNGGGDLEMFFRLLKAGHTLVYEPSALVRHRHRREYQQLRSQLANNGTGLYAYIVRSLLHYGDERVSFLKLALWWFWWWSLRRLLLSFVKPADVPRDLIVAELWGKLRGLTRYQRARAQADALPPTSGSAPVEASTRGSAPAGAAAEPRQAVAVRHVDLRQPVGALQDVQDYPQARVYVTHGRHLLGHADIMNNYAPIRPRRLVRHIVHHFGLRLFDLDQEQGQGMVYNEICAVLKAHYLRVACQETAQKPAALPDHEPVSVVVATLNRPDDLRVCLTHLLEQDTSRPMEVVVVDNDPASGLTPPVVADFPGVALVDEPRKGLAYARNAGFAACTGKVAVATDDDVIVPSDWLEKLLAPFSRPDVMVVTGNVLPLELENTAQQSFEQYGGLGRGFKRFEVDGRWFKSFRHHAVPTWELGATANAAFRTTLFADPAIGLMDEALGPGMPSGVGEDTYLFYRVLKAGYTLVYEPSAYVWHKHRRSMESLRRQLYNYSKGHVAYHLTTYLRDGDRRGLAHAFIHLPKWRLKQLLRHALDLVTTNALRGRGHYPLSLTMIEIAGNAAGVWALWQSRRRVRREGRSRPYVPVAQRRGQRPSTLPAEGQVLRQHASATGAR